MLYFYFPFFTKNVGCSSPVSGGYPNIYYRTIKNRAVPGNGLSDVLLNAVIIDRIGAKQQRHTPQRRKADQSVDHAADCGGLSAEQPCNDIKTEKSHAAPVNTADNGKDKGYAIHNHGFILLSMKYVRYYVPVKKKYTFDKRSAFSLFTRGKKQVIIMAQLIQLIRMDQAHIFIPHSL